MTADLGAALGVPVLAAPDLDLRNLPRSEARRARMRRWALAAAAALHLLVLAWPWLAVERAGRAPPAAEAIPVRLVFEQPPAPAPVPVPAPSPEPLKYRESGPDDRTTAPPAAQQPGPPKPEAPVLPAAKPQRHAALAPRGKAREEPTAPQPAPPRSVEVAIDSMEHRGDPYLNRLMVLIERQRLYPPAAASRGMAGTAVYYMLIDRSGALQGLTTRRSSGTQVLDEAGASMIRNAAPFPPLPPDLPHTVLITVAIPLYPP